MAAAVAIGLAKTFSHCELLLPGPAPGKMQGQSACRAGDPSDQGKDPSSEGLGGHDLLTQADAGCPAGQVVRHHLYRQPGAVGGEAARGEMVQPHAVLEVAYRILDLGVTAMISLQFKRLPVPVGDEAVIAVGGEESQLRTGRRLHPPDDEPYRRGVRLGLERGAGGLDRSVEAAREGQYKDRKGTVRQWNGWSSLNGWVDRAAEHDSDLASRRRERMEKELDRAKDDAAVLIRAILAKVAERIQGMDADELAAGQIPAALRTLIELELKVLGYEDRVAVTGKDGGPVKVEAKTEHVFQPTQEAWDDVLRKRAEYERLRDGDTDEDTPSDSL